MVKIPAGGGDFSHLQSGHTDPGAHSASPIRWVSGTVSLGGIERNVVTNLPQTTRHHIPEDYNIRTCVSFHCTEFIIFLHGLGRLICSGIDALPSFPGASTISSSSGFVVEGMFRESVVIHSLKVADPIFFVEFLSF